MFTTLLANASNIKTLDKAHPKYAQIVQNMTPDEALIIQYLKDKKEICYVDFRGHKENDKSYYDFMSYVTLIPNDVKLTYPKNINAYIANLISSGILLDMKGTYITNDTWYNKIEQYYRPRLEERLVPKIYNKITIEKSYLQITDFGILFINACIA